MRHRRQRGPGLGGLKWQGYLSGYQSQAHIVCALFSVRPSFRASEHMALDAGPQVSGFGDRQMRSRHIHAVLHHAHGAR